MPHKRFDGAIVDLLDGRNVWLVLHAIFDQNCLFSAEYSFEHLLSGM